MKTKLWNRLLIALSGLFIFAIGVCVVLFSIGFTPSQLDLAALEASLVLWQRVVIAAVGVLICLLGFHDICVLFARRAEKGFIMQRTDLGDMSISMNALETMVHKCVDQHQELTVKSTRIFRVKNGIVVEIRIVLASGVNIPLTVSALQKQIKQYIVSCSGVEVYEVKVLVETNVNKPHHLKEQKAIVVDARKPVEPAAKVETPIVSAPAAVFESDKPAPDDGSTIADEAVPEACIPAADAPETADSAPADSAPEDDANEAAPEDNGDGWREATLEDDQTKEEEA